MVLDTDYYYRVYAVTSYGTYSMDTPIAVQVHTLSNPIPWGEGAEAALVNWDVGSPEALLDDAVSGPNVDLDGDGIGQMIEWACHMDPSVRSRTGAPSHALAEVGGVTHLAIEFNRRIGTDLHFVLQSSEDMIDWVDVDANVEVMRGVDPETEHCRIIDPAPRTGARRFVRLSVRVR